MCKLCKENKLFNINTLENNGINNDNNNDIKMNNTNNKGKYISTKKAMVDIALGADNKRFREERVISHISSQTHDKLLKIKLDKIDKKLYLKHKEGLDNILNKKKDNFFQLKQNISSIDVNIDLNINNNTLQSKLSIQSRNDTKMFENNIVNNEKLSKDNPISNKLIIDDFNNKNDYEKIEILTEYQQYLQKRDLIKRLLDQHDTFLKQNKLININISITPLYERIVGLLRLVNDIIVQGCKLYKLQNFAETVTSLGGIPLTHNISRTTGTALALALAKAQMLYNTEQIVTSLTFSYSFDCQSLFGTSWFILITLIINALMLKKGDQYNLNDLKNGETAEDYKNEIISIYDEMKVEWVKQFVGDSTDGDSAAQSGAKQVTYALYIVYIYILII